jgi:hypothetical protein
VAWTAVNQAAHEAAIADRAKDRRRSLDTRT